MPESFWLGWYTVLAGISAFLIVTAILYRVGWGTIFGICIGLGLVALVTVGLRELSLGTVLLILFGLVCLIFIQSTLSVERSMYKWRAGRPDNEL